MSKVDAQRAFREANYARRNTGAKPVDPPPAVTPAKPAAVDLPASPAPPPAVNEALCGHRSMGNKTCSRPAGHPEKNHRYK